MSLPTGTLTFLFTDIEGSTQFWETSPETMRVSLARHDDLMRTAIADAGGIVFKTIGDAFCAVFSTAPGAVKAVLKAQHAIQTESWPQQTPLKVRMALHTGLVEERDGDYFGPPVNRVARLLSIAHGGQSLLSQATCDLALNALPQSASLKDLGSHQLKDLTQPEHVYQILSPELLSEFPPILSLSTHPNNLPQQLTSFIGREKETTDIQALLLKTRLLTLTGAGGTGKTRLSLQVAANTLERYPDGTWFVELAPLTDPDQVPSTVATTLGVKEEAGRSITQALTEHLKGKRLLLVLDNCEHLLGACAPLANSLLQQCPHVQILASSREGLGIMGEQTYRVPSLSLPDSKQRQTPDTLAQYESVRLFLDRALLARSDFQVTTQNAPVLASVCHRLDGIPLAIELAAARVRSLSIEDINGKLDQRFRLLTGGPRTALPRQQTLRSLIDWSYDLLQENEKQLLARLSVFAGGFNLEAVEKVCEGGSVEAWETLDLLTSLGDKSLLVYEERSGTARYRLLETVRAYGRERLNQFDETEEYCRRHADYYRQLAAEMAKDYGGRNQTQALATLSMEHDNLSTALDFCTNHPNPALHAEALRLCFMLDMYWKIRGYTSLGRAYLETSLSLPGAQPGTQDRIRALNLLGSLCWEQGDYITSQACGEEALKIIEQAGLDEELSTTLSRLALDAWYLGQYDRSIEIYLRCLALDREQGDKGKASVTLNNLGLTAVQKGDYAKAWEYYEEGLAIRREVGNQLGIATILLNMGELALVEKDLDRADSLIQQSLKLNIDHGFARGVAYSKHGLGNVQLALGDLPGAERFFLESMDLRLQWGEKYGVAILLVDLAYVRWRLGQAESSACLLGAAEAIHTAISNPMLPAARERFEEARQGLSEQLGTPRFESLFDSGHTLPFDQIGATLAAVPPPISQT